MSALGQKRLRVRFHVKEETSRHQDGCRVQRYRKEWKMTVHAKHLGYERRQRPSYIYGTSSIIKLSMSGSCISIRSFSCYCIIKANRSQWLPKIFLKRPVLHNGPSKPHRLSRQVIPNTTSLFSKQFTCHLLLYHLIIQWMNILALSPLKSQNA